MSLSNRELNLAYLTWYQSYQFQNADKMISPFLYKDIQPDPGQWIRTVRQARLLSIETVAERLKISKSTCAKYEKTEKLGTIRLDTLQQIAEAMDCDFIYAFRPKQNRKFSEVIWSELLQESLADPWVQSRATHVKAQALGAVAKKKFKDTEFRKTKGWTSRIETEQS